jgi:5-hydroxyisourate hydrolase-like protein (transthyretin family)
VSGLLNSLLVTSKKDTKQLDELIKNSHTDGKMLSNWNIQLQSMKVGNYDLYIVTGNIYSNPHLVSSSKNTDVGTKNIFEKLGIRFIVEC